MKHHSIALGALFLTSLPLSAVTLVAYDFNDTINGVSESAPGVITEVLSRNTAASSTNSGFVRTTTGPENGAGSLAILFSNLDSGEPPASGTAAADNVSFTVSTGSGQFLQLQSLTFLTGMNSDQPTGAVYSVQYNLGAGYVNIGSSFTETMNLGETRTIDLSDPIFSSVSSISFRINITEPLVSTNAGNASARLDDIFLNGSVIPEPSSLALFAAAGLFVAGRRSRR